MNYEDMSDRQINKRVARALDVEWIAVAQDGLIVDGQSASVDYCNNPSDAWPIIVDNKIGITHGSQMCSAVAVTDNELIQIPCNPSELLRAAMICFLKMKDSEK